MLRQFSLLLLSLIVGADVSVFFIGNSYTQFNNMVFEFQKVAQSRMPGTTVTVVQNVVGGRDLGAAAADANLLASLRGGVKYDFIVLQDQSLVGGIPANSGWAQRESGEESVKTVFSPIAKDMGATLVFYQTWGRRNDEAINWGFTDFLSMERSLEDGYATYADIASREGCAETMISRAGLLFKKIYESSSSQGLTPSTDSSTLFWKLYGSDGSHPSAIGTYAIATAMFYAMFPQSSYPGWQDTWYKHSSVNIDDAKMISQFGFETSSSQIEQVDPAIKQLWGHYTNSFNSRQIWVIRAPALLCLHDVTIGSCAELVVSASGVVECPHYQTSVVSVTQFAAEITWNDTDVFSLPAVCGPDISVTSVPTGAPVATNAPPVTPAPVPAVTAAPLPVVTSAPVPVVTSAPAVTSIPVSSVTSIPAVTSAPIPVVTSAPAVTSIPVSSVTSIPAVTSPPIPVVTSIPAVTSAPIPVVTSAPAVTSIPVSSVTSVPAVTSAPIPVVTSIPKPAETSTPNMPAITSIPNNAPAATSMPGTSPDVPSVPFSATGTPEADLRSSPSPVDQNAATKTDDNSSSNTGLIIGIVVGSVLLIVMGGAVAHFCLKKSKNAVQESESHAYTLELNTLE